MSDDKFYLRHTGGETLASYHFKSGPWYKLLNPNLVHFGVEYQEGLNVDPVPFNPNGDCEAGGLYFCHFDFIARWRQNLNWTYIANVTLPEDARVYVEPCGTKLKADRIELSNIRPLSEFLATVNENRLQQMVEENPWLLEHITRQTEWMCLTAVRSRGYLLRYVRQQTDAIRMAAVNQDPWALKWADPQTPELCREAVARDTRVWKVVYQCNLRGGCFTYI
jgi:hypothetical protein